MSETQTTESSSTTPTRVGDGLAGSHRRWTPFGVVIALFVAAAVTMAQWRAIGVSFGDFTPALDDGWIHVAFAKNLAENGTWGLNAGQASTGCSSILWVLMLAGAIKLGLPAIATALVINLICVAIIAIVIHSLVVEVLEPVERAAPAALWATVVALVAAISGNLIWHAFTGMETLLFLTLGLLAMWLAARERVILMGIIIFLAGLTRPEGFLVGVAIMLWQGVYGKTHSRRCRRAKVWPVAAAVAAGSLLANMFWQFVVSGQLLPSSVIGRSWIINHDPGLTLNPWVIVKNLGYLLGVSGYRFMEFSLGQAGWTEFGAKAETAWMVAIVGAIVTIVGLAIVWFRSTSVMGMVWMWAVLHTLAYAMVLPTRGHGGRYLPMDGMILAMALGVGAVFVAERLSVSRSVTRRMLACALVLAVVATVGVSNRVWAGVANDSIGMHRDVHLAAARWIKANTAEDATVAAFDIGAIAAESGRHVLDLSGLMDPAVGNALRAQTVDEVIEREKPEYIAMIFPKPDRMLYYNACGLQKLQERGELASVAHFDQDGAIVVEKSPAPDWTVDAVRVCASRIVVYRCKYPVAVTTQP